MKPAFVLLLSLSSFARAECVPLTGERIVGTDLALADPRFAALPASAIVGWAPAPGVKRTFAAAELARIAKAYGIEPWEGAEVCFEIPLRQIDTAAVISEMNLALPGARIKVLELSQAPVPQGKIEFPVAGLEPVSIARPGARLWRGYVRYSETKRLPVWARVEVSQTLMAVVAVKDLATNAPIELASVRTEKRSVFTQDLASRLEDVLGLVPKKAIRAGEPIPLSLLVKAPDVRRGEVVHVEVRSGSTRLQLSAIAERDGHSGEFMDLRNPSSGKTFRARLDGARAVVLVGGL